MDQLGLLSIAIPCLISGALGLAAPDFWAACDEHLADRFGNPYPVATDPSHLRTASTYVLAAAVLILSVALIWK